jgi:hypothetical protein
VAQAECWADVLRYLGYGIKGGNYRTLQRWAVHWDISSDHFDARARTSRSADTRRIPLEEIMVEHSSYSRGKLKRRLLAAGIKQPVCEMCGQGELWCGRRMSLVLDHVNGVADDHRLENLRMLCPNCNATLDTHCGRNTPSERVCPSCEHAFVPASRLQRYCSRKCWGRVAGTRSTGHARPETRKVERPSYEQLQRDVAELSMVAVGRKYGVSDNAVRKWLRWYAAATASEQPAGTPRSEQLEPGTGHCDPKNLQLGFDLEQPAGHGQADDCGTDDANARVGHVVSLA